MHNNNNTAMIMKKDLGTLNQEYTSLMVSTSLWFILITSSWFYEFKLHCVHYTIYPTLYHIPDHLVADVAIKLCGEFISSGYKGMRVRFHAFLKTITPHTN